VTEVTRQLLTTLEPDDIEVAGIATAYLKALADEPGHVRVKCTACESHVELDDQLLGTEVTCEHCGERFVADWGYPIIKETKQVEAESSAPSDH
jgi:DNA-directed RNA polymerase subunit RPC12/RpoP